MSRSRSRPGRRHDVRSEAGPEKRQYGGKDRSTAEHPEEVFALLRTDPEIGERKEREKTENCLEIKAPTHGFRSKDA